MKITMTTTMREIDEILLKEAQRVERLTVSMLARLGEMCVKEARDRPAISSWIDQTGNLRSSIGYVIVKNDEIVSLSEFNQVKDGSEGVAVGKELALELANKQSDNYALIVVAGMNYAVFVEAMENKSVLASAEIFAMNELPEMLAQLERQLNK